MKPKIKNRGVVPYGGTWKYRDPYTGEWITGYLWDTLLTNIQNHRRANGFPIGLDFENEVEKQVCINHPDECDNLPDALPKKANLNLSDIVRGSSVMMRFYAAGKPLVEYGEAIKRAEICCKCPMNDDFSRPCAVGICKELLDVVGAIVNAVGTPYDGRLKSCRICHCFLRASIHLPLSIQCGAVTDKMREQFDLARREWGCWKQCTDET